MERAVTLIVLLLTAIIAAPFIAERLRKPMDGVARNTAPGHFVECTDGTTHVQLRGPTDAPLIVCVHGLTTPSFVWGDIAADLVTQGYNVLSYDLFGRGFSDRPKGKQDEAFFLRQLQDVLNANDVPETFTLMGYSMGASISVAYAAQNPQRIKTLILIAPAGMSTTTSRSDAFMRDTPLVGDWIVSVLGGISRRKRYAGLKEADPRVAMINAKQLAESDYRGFLPAVLSSGRHMLRDRQTAHHQTLDASGITTLAIWGEDDKVIPLSAMGEMTQANRTVIHETVAGADHGLPYTHPGAVTKILRDFLLRT